MNPRIFSLLEICSEMSNNVNQQEQRPPFVDLVGISSSLNRSNLFFD